MKKSVNKDLAIEKGLIVGNDCNLYVQIENLYKYLFEYYLLSKVNLKKYDDEILNSNLYFGIPHPVKQQLISNLNEYYKFNYIYVMNNFFIEKLSVDDLNILKYALKVPNLRPTQNLISLIIRTYKDVIKDNYTTEGYKEEIYKVCYGYAIPTNFADNDALVLKIFYSKNGVELSNEEFLQNVKAKKELLKKVENELVKDINNNMNLKVKVITEKIPN